MTVKNIIFDLGGVILDLGFTRMINSFEQLGVKDFLATLIHKNKLIFLKN